MGYYQRDKRTVLGSIAKYFVRITLGCLRTFCLLKLLFEKTKRLMEQEYAQNAMLTILKIC
ncbi:hypothetical protein [Lysinibacillus fusiformis]